MVMRTDLAERGSHSPTVVERRTGTPVSWDDLLDRLLHWASDTAAVRGLVLIGSRARADRPADEWSDLDLILVTDDRERTIPDETWLGGVADVWATLVHPGPLPDAPVRQVVFAGGYDVDMVGLPPDRLQRDRVDAIVGDLLARGHRVLLDKDDQLNDLPPSGDAPPPTLPTPDQVEWVVNDLFIQFVWATKHLRRGDVWQARADVDGYMHDRLLSLIEWHSITNGRPVATWRGAASGGRSLEQWADPAILDALPATFAPYSPAGVASALRNLVDLVGRIGPDVAAAVGAEYPQARHDAMRGWLDATLG